MTYAIVYNIKYKICINMYKYLGGLFRAGPTGFMRAGLLRAYYGFGPGLDRSGRRASTGLGPNGDP